MQGYISKSEFKFHRSTFVAYVMPDTDHGTPWENEDGHGDVTPWTTRKKRPGELILSRDASRYRYYDFAAACRKAIAERWGLPLAELQKRQWIGLNRSTPRQRASAAAMLDYENLRAWCNDEWGYVGVVVYRLDKHGNEMRHEMECLWGIESTSDDYLETVKLELAGQINHARRAARKAA